MACSCSNKNYHVFCNIQNPLFSFTDLWTHSLSFFGWYKVECLETAPCSRADLERFINYDSGFHHALKFKLEISETFLSFLAISVLINGDALASSFHYKPTDSHSYLFFLLPPQPHQEIHPLLPIFAPSPPLRWWQRFGDQIFENENRFWWTWLSHPSISFRDSKSFQ